MDMGKKLDTYEKKIVAELVKNPRLSDNQISRVTQIPLKTVNRKRKKLEASGLLNYYSFFDAGPNGLKLFSASAIYEIRLRAGITRLEILDAFSKAKLFSKVQKRHLKHVILTERDGNIIFLVFLESYSASDLFEILNADIIPDVHSSFGQTAVLSVQKFDGFVPLVLANNYKPTVNMVAGKLDPSISLDDIFIAD